jgi:hypothetical protein
MRVKFIDAASDACKLKLRGGEMGGPVHGARGRRERGGPGGVGVTRG